MHYDYRASLNVEALYSAWQYVQRLRQKKDYIIVRALALTVQCIALHTHSIVDRPHLWRWIAEMVEVSKCGQCSWQAVQHQGGQFTVSYSNRMQSLAFGYIDEVEKILYCSNGEELYLHT